MKLVTFTAILLATAPSCAAELTSRDMGALTRNLSNPDSAKVRNVRISPAVQQIVCGEIDWRSETGEYIGFKGFWIEPFEGQYAIETQNEAYEAGSRSFGCV